MCKIFPTDSHLLLFSGCFKLPRDWRLTFYRITPSLPKKKKNLKNTAEDPHLISISLRDCICNFGSPSSYSLVVEGFNIVSCNSHVILAYHHWDWQDLCSVMQELLSCSIISLDFSDTLSCLCFQKEHSITAVLAVLTLYPIYLSRSFPRKDIKKMLFRLTSKHAWKSLVLSNWFSRYFSFIFHFYYLKHCLCANENGYSLVKCKEWIDLIFF